jgi:hypothetical protein
VGYDGSDVSGAAIVRAAERAGRDGTVVIVHACAPPSHRGAGPDEERMTEEHRARARELLARALECADGPQGVSLETVLVEDRPAEALLGVAKGRDASEVVVGAHSCGHAWNSIGSVSAELIQTADLPLRLVGVSAP